MDKYTFFKQAMKAHCYAKKAWVISAFSVISEAADAYTNDPYDYRIVRTPTAIGFVDPAQNKAITFLDRVSATEPLFQFKEPIVVDASFCPNATSPIETTLGNVIANLCILVHSFGTKFPYLTGRFDIRSIEDKIAERLIDTPEPGATPNPTAITVDEYIRFVDSLSYLANFSLISVWAATEKTLTVSKDFPAFKAQLLKKYEGKLHDPIQVSAFEKELQAFDEQYLNDDPSNGVFLSGKVKNISRKKLHLTIGGIAGFGDGLTLTPVTNSLEEGWPTEPEAFTAMMNDLRIGSFSRGTETIKGGVTNKVFLRSGSNFKIVPEDCGTLLGIERVVTPRVAKTLIGRSILTKSGWLEITSAEQTQGYIDKTVTIRSPMFCHQPGDRICQYCAGKRLSENPLAVSSALVEVSSIILTTSMKQMHGSVLKSVPLHIDKVLS